MLSGCLYVHFWSLHTFPKSNCLWFSHDLKALLHFFLILPLFLLNKYTCFLQCSFLPMLLLSTCPHLLIPVAIPIAITDNWTLSNFNYGSQLLTDSFDLSTSFFLEPQCQQSSCLPETSNSLILSVFTDFYLTDVLVPSLPRLNFKVS